MAGAEITEVTEVTVADAAAWHAWLVAHLGDEAGVWLVMAKKGTTSPTSLTYDQALEEALCVGWIDGRRRGRDASTFLQHFTPRRSRSLWSQRNVGLVERLTSEGRMHPAGLREVERAQADGRWEAAYAGPATMQVPPELAAALDARPAAAALFAALDGQNRYAVLHRVTTARRPETRQRLADQYVAMLERGETIYPRS